MGIFTKLGWNIFAPQDSGGAARKVTNSEAQVWASEVESLLTLLSETPGTFLAYATKSELDADVDETDKTLALVYYDTTQSNNGWYSWNDTLTQWDFVRSLSDQIAVLENTGGTANAITADVPQGINFSSIKLYVLTPIIANTSSTVTLARNSETTPLSIKDADGSSIGVSTLAANVPVVLYSYSSTELRVLFNVAAAQAAQAAAEAAQAAAEAAAETVVVGKYNSRAGLAAANVNAAVQSVWVMGRDSPADSGGPVKFDRVGASEPSHDGKEQSADGDWWELVTEDVRSSMFGTDRAAIVSAISYSNSKSAKSVTLDTDTSFSSADRIDLHSDINLIIAATLTNTSTSTDAGMFDVSGCSNVTITMKAGSKLVGPYSGTTPSPTSAYPGINAAIICSGTAGGARTSNFTLISEGAEITDWGTSCGFLENIDGVVIRGNLYVHNCGVEGFRFYGCKHVDAGHGIRFGDLGPGVTGNVYGFTATRNPARTTRLLDYSDFSTGNWTRDAASITSDDLDGSTADMEDLDETLSMDKLVEDGTTAAHQVRQDVTLDPTVTNTVSIEGKADERSILRVTLQEGSGSNFIRAHFDLSAGTVLLTYAGGTGTVTTADITEIDAGSGIYKCRLVGVASTSGTVCRVAFQMLSSAVSGSAGGSYAGDSSSGLHLDGAQLLEGNVDHYAQAIRVYPPTMHAKFLNGTSFGSNIWKVLDTHGGRHIVFDNWVIQNCALPVGVDEGDTSGEENAPPKHVYIDNIKAVRGSASAGQPFMSIVSSSADTRGEDIFIGGGCYGRGFGTTTTGAISVSYCDNVRIQNPYLEDCQRAGISLKNGPISGTISATVKNLTGSVVAAIAAEATKCNVVIEGVRAIRTTGSYTLFLIAAQDAGYDIVVNDNIKQEGTITRWSATNDVTQIAGWSPIHKRIHARGVMSAAGTATNEYNASSVRTSNGVYTITLTEALQNTALARVMVDTLGSNTVIWNVTYSSTTSVEIRLWDDTGVVFDNDFQWSILAA